MNYCFYPSAFIQTKVEKHSLLPSLFASRNSRKQSSQPCQEAFTGRMKDLPSKQINTIPGTTLCHWRIPEPAVTKDFFYTQGEKQEVCYRDKKLCDQCSQGSAGHVLQTILYSMKSGKLSHWLFLTDSQSSLFELKSFLDLSTI